MVNRPTSGLTTGWREGSLLILQERRVRASLGYWGRRRFMTPLMDHNGELEEEGDEYFTSSSYRYVINLFLWMTRDHILFCGNMRTTSIRAVSRPVGLWSRTETGVINLFGAMWYGFRRLSRDTLSSLGLRLKIVCQQESVWGCGVCSNNVYFVGRRMKLETISFAHVLIDIWLGYEWLGDFWVLALLRTGRILLTGCRVVGSLEWTKS